MTAAQTAEAEYIVTEIADGICEIRLNRPDKKNALLGAMYTAIAQAFEQGAARQDVGAFLISAQGPTFSAGNDIGDFLSLEGDFLQSPQGRFVRAIADCPKPLVAAVQGAAIGVGTTMLLHCDLVFASPEATLSTPFVDIGLVPEAGSTWLLPQRIGYQRAAAMLLLAEPLTAAQAEACGLVNGVVAADKLVAHARGVALALTRKPPMALAAARSLMRGDRQTLKAHMHKEAVTFGQALRGNEARAAFSAFTQRKG
jgi:enoyl-CoA hydratase/carnithine racemase